MFKKLREMFFYEEHILDFKELDPLHIYLYRLCPYIFIRIIQEDRRPDLSKEEAQGSLGYKFKTQIFVRFLWLEYSFILHSLSTGFVYKYDYSKISTIIRSLHKYGWINENLISIDLNSDFLIDINLRGFKMYKLYAYDEKGLPTMVSIDNGFMKTSVLFDMEEPSWLLDQLNPMDYIAVKICRDTERLVSEVNHLKRELFETKRQLKRSDDTLNKLYQESKENFSKYLSHILTTKGE